MAESKPRMQPRRWRVLKDFDLPLGKTSVRVFKAGQIVTGLTARQREIAFEKHAIELEKSED